jgi:hypothetical protein
MAAAGIQPVGEITHSTILAYIRQRDEDREYLASLAQYVAFWVVNATRPKDSWIPVQHVSPTEWLQHIKTPDKPITKAERQKMKKQRDMWDREIKHKHLGLIK